MNRSLFIARSEILSAPQKKDFRTARAVKTVLWITLALLICSVSAFAQKDGYTSAKRITFKRGEISTVINGTIKSRTDVHEFVFRARKGQTLKVRLRSAGKDVSFYLMDAAGDSMAPEPQLREWTGEITGTGDHRLILAKLFRGAASYSLEIQIASDI